MNRIIKRISMLLFIIATFMLGGFISSDTFANSQSTLSDEEKLEYSLNDIMFYQKCPTGDSSSSEICGTNKNYAGEQVFTDEQMKAIEANRPFYERAAAEYGIPWQLIAVIHKREHGLQRSNPSNGQGVYQFASASRRNSCSGGNFAAGAISDEQFQIQTNCVAEAIRNSYGSGLDLSTDEGVKKMFFKYNGTAQAYIDQALRLGFSQKEAENGEGSPYVMNRYDAKREPSSTWGQIKTDGGSIEYPANNDFGAFVYYKAIVCDGSKVNPDDSVSSSSSSADYVTTGISSSSSSVGDNAKKLAETALKLAWPKGSSESDYNRNKGGRPTDAIKAVWEELETTRRNENHGPDCGWFIQAVVAASGVDPEYTKSTKGSPLLTIDEWAEKNPNKWEIIDFSDGDASKLQSGDIIMGWGGGGTGFHAWTVVEIDGELYNVEASYTNKLWGRVSSKVGKKRKMLDKQTIFRAKGGTSCNACEQGSMNINGAAVCLAWPLGTDSSTSAWPNGTGTDLFNEFWAKEEGVVKGDGTGDCWDRGAYCCGFSAAAVRYSGYDPDFQSACDVGDHLGGGANQYLYVVNHPDLWELIPWNGDKSKVKGGDIIYYSSSSNGHSYVIVQDEKGEVYDAEASMCGFFGRINEFSAPPSAAQAFIFRAKNAKNSTAGISVTDGVKTSSKTGKVTGGTGQNNGDINATAFDLAWPEGTSANTYMAKAWDKFVEAFNSLPGRKNTGGQTWRDGKACMAFVSTVLNYAGAINIDKTSSVTWDLIKSDEWEEVGGEGNDGAGLKYKDLQPGDVLAYFASGKSSDGSAQYKGLGLHHEALYGETSTGEGRIIEASFESEWGHVRGKKPSPDDTIAGGWAKMVRVFRWKKQNGSSDCDVCAGETSSDGQLKAGGFDTVEEATKFMQSYIDAASPGGKYYDKSGDVLFGVKNGKVHDAGCPHGVLNNCVAFSQWFVNNYTTVGPNWNNTTNGVDLVGALEKKGLKRGTEPRPYAIFSKSGPSSDGHTGVILGVNTTTKKVIVGDAACNESSGKFYKPRAYELSFDDVKNWWYAYTDGVLSMGGPLKNA